MKILFTTINALALVLISSSILFAEEQLSKTKLNENAYDEIQQGNTVQWREATGAAQWTRREDAAFLSHNDHMWIISGDDGGSPHPNDVWLSDNGTNWTLATDTAPWTGRRDFVGLVYNGKMWIVGGIAMLYERLGDVWCSNDGTNWTQSTAEAPWAARGQHSGVVYNGKMWIFGGLDNSVNKNDVWNSTDGSNWTCVTTGAPWAARRGHASVVYDDKMWIMGGYGSDGLNNDVWWSTDGTNWTEATSSAEWTPRQFSGVTAYDGVMWMTGGGLDSSWEANDVWCSTNGATWVLDTEHASWVTRYGHALLVHKERMWLAGGADINTGQRLGDVWYSDEPPFVPAPPQNVQAGDGGYTDKVIITWNNCTGATKYVVYRNTTDTTNGAENISDEITGTTFDDTTAKPCETYYYRVKSGNDDGCSDFSDSDSGYAKTPAPTDINASDGTYTSKVEVTWNSYCYITNGLIGYWKFNDSNTIVDSSINGWTATNMGTTFSSSGKLNGSCYFDGNSDIRLNAPVLTNLPVTIELWAKPAETQPVTLQGYYTIMNNDKPFSGGHGIGINNVRGLYLNRRGWDTDGWTTGYTLPSEVWTHIAVVLEATQITLYTNGVIYDTWSHSSTEGRACGELFTRVGLRNEGSTDRFKGYMDEIRVWRGVRSGDEIASNFENELSSDGLKHMVYRNTIDDSSSASDISGEIADTSFDDTTANPGQTYYYWAKSKCNNSWSDFSDSDSGYKLLLAATGVSASDGDYTDKVEITWNASTGATKYKIYRNTANTTNGAEDISGEITDTSFDDTTAIPYATYYYWVKAGSDSCWSGLSDSDTGYKRLSIPTSVSASNGDYTNKVEITWDINTNATKYMVCRNTTDTTNGVENISGEIAGASFDDTTADPGQTYYYWVKNGCDNGWSDFSDSDSGYKRLSIPTGVSATDGIYDNKVLVTWSNVPYALTYIIYRSELNIASNATLLGQSVTNNIYSDSTVIPCKKYFYWIEANAAAGSSNLSESDSGFAFVSQGEPETEGKWKYKSKNGKAKLKVKGMGMETPLANYLEDGCLIGLKDASNYETVDGPHELEPLKKKTGEIKKWVYAVKKDVTIKYTPKSDQLIYKVWKDLPTEIIFFVVPPAETAQNASESDGLPVPVLEIYLQSGEKAGNGWKLLNPALIKNN